MLRLLWCLDHCSCSAIRSVSTHHHALPVCVPHSDEVGSSHVLWFGHSPCSARFDASLRHGAPPSGLGSLVWSAPSCSWVSPIVHALLPSRVSRPPGCSVPPSCLDRSTLRVPPTMSRPQCMLCRLRWPDLGKCSVRLNVSNSHDARSRFGVSLPESARSSFLCSPILIASSSPVGSPTHVLLRPDPGLACARCSVSCFGSTNQGAPSSVLSRPHSVLHLSSCLAPIQCAVMH